MKEGLLWNEIGKTEMIKELEEEGIIMPGMNKKRIIQ